MVIWLIDHGADPNRRCDWDYTPASLAIYTAPLELIDSLLERGADPLHGELLQYAIIREAPDALAVVRRLVEKGAPIDDIKYKNDPRSYYLREPLGLGTPLHRAAEGGQVDIVKYLLELGADPLKLDSKGRTPRFWAEKKLQKPNNDGAAETILVLKEAEESRLQGKQIQVFSLSPAQC